jgi:methionine sulfoxide reductase heme-binding subunit
MPTAGTVIAITGVIATAALTAVVVLGILVHGKRQLPGLTRHAGMDWHRNLSLLAVVFLAVHVLAAVTASYAGLGVAAVVVPFVSARQPLWIGLGAVSLDLLAAIVVTSMVRVRLGRRWWLAVHWLSYACWPAAMAHAIGIGPAMRAGRLLDLAVACIAAVVVSAAWRVTWALRAVPRARRVPELMRALERTLGPVPAGQDEGSGSRAGQAPGDG